MQKVIDEFDGVLIDEYGWEHYQIKGKKYGGPLPDYGSGK